MCTLTVDDHTSRVRRQALHARPRADLDPRRGAADRPQGPPLLRDERGRRAVDRQAHPDGLPAARARPRGRPSSPSSTWASGTRSRSPWPARRRSSTPRTPGSGAALDEHPLLRQAGADDRRQDRPHRRRAGDRDPPPRLHDQPARGVRRRGGGADRRAARRQLDRAHARAARGRGAAARRDGARHRPGDPARRPTAELGPQATAAAIVEAIAAERAAGTSTT